MSDINEFSLANRVGKTGGVQAKKRLTTNSLSKATVADYAAKAKSKARYDATVNCETPAQIATRTNKAKVLTDAQRKALYLTVAKLVELDNTAAYYVISCDGTKLLSTHDTYKEATDAITDTCDVLVFSPFAMATEFTPAPVRSCDASVTWQNDHRNPATVPLGNPRMARANTATKEHKLASNVGARV